MFRVIKMIVVAPKERKDGGPYQQMEILSSQAVNLGIFSILSQNWNRHIPPSQGVDDKSTSIYILHKAS